MAKKRQPFAVKKGQHKQDARVSEESPKAPSDGTRIAFIGFDRYHALFLALLIFIGFIIYSNTLDAPFVLDDLGAIQNNPYIRMEEISGHNIIDAAVGYGKNRPVAMLSFAFNYYFGQYNVFGYHLVNIIVHITTGILLFFLVKLTLMLSNQQTNASYKLDPITLTTLSFFTALLWLVNPVQTQSVTYIVQRMNSMGAMFYILALWLYAKGRIAQQLSGRKVAARSRCYLGWFVGCFLAGILALGSKESTALLPIFIFLYEWYFFQDLDKKWFKRQLKYLVAIGILVGVVAGLYLGFDPAEKFKNLRDYELGEFSMGQRLLTQTRVVVYYLSLIFYPNPSRLNLDHDFALSNSLFNPFTTFLSIITIVGLIALGLYLAHKQRLISFCIFWYLGNLVIESSVIPLAIIFEHRLYLPSMFVFLLVVILFYRAIKPAWLTAVMACALVVLCSYWTYERNITWQDEFTLWTDCVRKSPNKARPYTNLGKVLTDQKRYDEALFNFKKAIHIKPNFVEANFNLGRLYERLDETDKAMAQYRKSLRINPNYVDAHNNLGTLLLSQDKTDEAIEQFRAALQISPDFAKAHNNLGLALSKSGKPEAAIEQYNIALKLDPSLPEGQFNLGNALIEQGQTEQGLIHIKKALQLRPDYAEAHNNLGGQLLRQGKMDEALEHLTRALSINPDLVQAHNNVGIILIQKGNLDAAIAHFQDALRIDPEFEPAQNNLRRALAMRGSTGMQIEQVQKEINARPDDPVSHFKMGNLYLSKGELSKAIGEFEKALSLRPDFPEARNNLAMAYAADRQYDRALAELQKLIELDPDTPSTYYNIAVLYALQNKVTDSLAWLKKAVAIGYNNWELIKTDKDLENIRNSDDYKQLVKGH
jgi:tetratricopeptide (TPR) repeat protein